MSIIYVLIPIAVLLTAVGLYLFFWAVKTEQFDDLEKQGLSILFDDKDNNTSSKNHELINENMTDITSNNNNNENKIKNNKDKDKDEDEDSAYNPNIPINTQINTSNKTQNSNPINHNEH